MKTENTKAAIVEFENLTKKEDTEKLKSEQKRQYERDLFKQAQTMMSKMRSAKEEEKNAQLVREKEIAIEI